MKQLSLLFFLLTSNLLLVAQTLTDSSSINISKTWSQEPTGHTYPIFVKVPVDPPPASGYPVCILLHGFGGNGQGMINQFGSKFECHALVAVSGYSNSWNISDEPSEAPDIEMIEDLVDTLQSFTNLNPNKIRILGFSNGAALSNRIFIENKNAGIDAICAVVSQLSEAQFRNDTFYYPSGATGGTDTYDGYDSPTLPLSGRKYLSVCNDNDMVVPYTGGATLGVNFLDAQDATFAIAQSQGFTGSQITGNGTDLGSDVYEFDYLSGQVVHLKGSAGHGLNQTQEDYILDFFQDCQVSTNIEQSLNPKKYKIFPNPVTTLLQVEGLNGTESFQLTNSNGQMIYQGNDIQTVNWSSFPKGFYFLRILDPQGSFIAKIIR